MLRLSEHYVSIQGEGPRTGLLTQFVRFAGCNMRCPGWPCDTPFAIDPKIWRHDSEKLSVDELLERITDEEVENVCLTGGEPFMQPNEDLNALCLQLRHLGHRIECFSNGSFLYPPWALDDIHFIMDWKLAGSGEARTDRATRLHNALHLKRKDSIKFVVKDKDDLKEALSMSVILQTQGCQAQLWVGAAWGCIAESEIADFIKEMGTPWRLNVQAHKYIWPAAERRV